MSKSFNLLTRLLLLTLLLISNVVTAAPPTGAPEVYVDGELMIVHIDYLPGKGKSKFVYHIKEQGTGEIHELEFEHKPPKNLRTGDKINIRGKQYGKKLWVLDIAGAQEPSSSTEPPTSSMESLVAEAATNYQALYMLVSMVDSANNPLYTFTESNRGAGENVMFNNSYSVDSVYQEGSFGNAAYPGPNQNGGKVIVVTIEKPANLGGGGCDYYAIASRADAAANTQFGASDLVSNYNRKIYWVPPSSLSSCGWLALGQVGSYGSTATLLSWTTSNSANAIIHEVGHNHGWHHAATDFNNNEQLDTTSSSEEYGDTSGAMGYCCNQRKFNSVHLHQIGWLPGSDVVTVTSGGTYHIAPLGDAGVAYPQVLLIEKDSSIFSYYLSYRQVKNLDLNLNSTYTQGVNIHNGRLNNNWSYFVGSLADGETFEDLVNGVSIYQVSHDADSVELNISLTGPQPPTDPDGLLASAASANTIDLVWNDNADNETGYTVERSDDGVNGWLEVATLTANAKNHTDSGLTPSTTYYYRVIAHNGSTPSDNPSNVDYATTDDPPPFIDQVASSESLVAGTVSGSYSNTWTDDSEVQSIEERESGGKPRNRYSYLENRWFINVVPGNAVTLFIKARSSGSSDGDSFEFDYSTDGGASFNNGSIIVSNTTDQSPVSLPLPNTTNGTVIVRVRDTDRQSTHRELNTVYVDEIRIRTDSNTGGTVPEAPILKSASAPAHNQVNITWSDVADEYGYEIERSTNAGGWVQIGTVGTDVASYQDTSVSELTSYDYHVRAYNGSGTSGYSNTLNVTTLEGPSNSISLTASGYKLKGTQHVKLTWSGVSTSNVVIFRNDVKIANTAVGNSPYDDNTGFKGGGSYEYYVCDKDSTNCSPTQQVIF